MKPGKVCWWRSEEVHVSRRLVAPQLRKAGPRSYAKSAKVRAPDSDQLDWKDWPQDDAKLVRENFPSRAYVI